MSTNDLGPTRRKRGPKSQAELAVLVPDIRMQRPEPPATLVGPEAEIWREIVEKTRPGWFYGCEHLLVLYCRHLSHERLIASALEGVEVGSPRHLTLSRLLQATTSMASRLAAQLRLSPRSTVDRYTPRLAPATPKPWEQKPDDDPTPAAA